jgi:hypothetical protein
MDVSGESDQYQGYLAITSYPGGIAKEAGTMKRKLILLVSLIVTFLAACSQAENPEQIAAHPMEEAIAVYSHFPESMLVYNATLEMEVSNVERAAERAKQIAFEQGGYLVSTQSWYRDGERHTTVVLAVPAYRFDNTREEVLRLGKLVGEWVSSDLISPGGARQDVFAHITIYLHPRESILPEISLPKWRPVRTFEKAWGFFLSIFGFILDILIWIVVVIGPFVLIGWGIKKAIQWWSAKIGHQK